MKKPIILGVEGESAEILHSARAGYCIEPENSEELATRLLDLHADRALCSRFGANGRAHVIAHYDRVKLAKRFEQLLVAAGT